MDDTKNEGIDSLQLVKRIPQDLADKLEHKCGLCDKVLSSSQSLRNHISLHTKEQYFQCQQCSKSYSARSRLNAHINYIHSKAKTFQCKFSNCGKFFTRPNNLKSHLAMHDPESALHSLVPCSICGAKYKKRNLRNHMNYYHNSKTYSCDICSRICKSLGNLEKHSLIHMPASERPVLPCTICDKVFLDRRTLATHKKYIHFEKSKKPTCPFCNKKFNYAVGLTNHLRSHTKEKPCFCLQCDKCFSTESDLYRHVRAIHKNEKKYKCTECSKEFNDKCQLNKHILVHSNGRSYNCKQCQKCFKSRSILREHEKTHLDNRPTFPCTICNNTYKYKTGLRRHTKEHSNNKFKCDLCKKVFITRANLSGHIKSVHSDREYKFKCQYCEQIFSLSHHLNSHIQVHTREKPYPCTKCTKMFAMKHHLNWHLQRAHGNEVLETGRNYTKIDTLKCKHCFKSFATKKSLFQHSVTHRIEIELNCRPCFVVLERL